MDFFPLNLTAIVCFHNQSIKSTEPKHQNVVAVLMEPTVSVFVGGWVNFMESDEG